MKIYKFQIEPFSSFYTYPKGDMLFAFFVHWWIKLKKDTSIIENIVFSDFLPIDHFPKPSLPIDYFTNDINKRKELKSKDWIQNLDNLNSIFTTELKKGDKSIEFYTTSLNIRNSLNKLTLTTDENFSLYSYKEYVFNYPIALYIATTLDIKKIEEFLNLIGSYGFGKNSNLKGKFQAKFIKKCNWQKADYGISLSPIITKNAVSYELFTRYGKHYHLNPPFKKPILMCNSGSVVKFIDFIDGKNYQNGIKHPSIIQGKSIIYPFNLKVKDEN